MRMMRLLGVCSCLLALLSVPTAKAQSTNTFSCDLAEMMPDWMRLSPIVRKLQFVQTLTVPGTENSFNVRVCSSGGRDAPAERILSHIGQFLPTVAHRVGLHYLGSRQWTIMIVERNEMPENILGLTGTDMVWLPIDVDDWTIIHELSHFWANDDHFIDPWMSEGYAEYVTEHIAIERGLRRNDLTPNRICLSKPLVSWNYNNGQAARCGYDVGAAVFRDLAQEIGSDTMRAALGSTNGQINSTGMLQLLEQASGKDLSEIMQRWRVFPDDVNAWFDQRRAARASLAEIQQLANALGYPLSPEYASLIQNGDFAEALEGLAYIQPRLKQANTIRQSCTNLQLACRPVWQQPDLDQLTNVQQILDLYRPLATDAQMHDLAMPMSLRQSVELFEPNVAADLRMATELLKQGIELEQLCTNAPACRNIWRTDWSAGLFNTVGQNLTMLQSLVNQALQVEQKCATARDGCHTIWQAALQAGGPNHMRDVLQDIQGLLDSGPVLSERCGPFQQNCDAAWRTPLSQGDLLAAQQAYVNVHNLPIKVRDLEPRCTTAGWTCEVGWRVALQKSGLPAALQVLDKTDAALARVQVAAAGVDRSEPNGFLALIEQITGRSPDSLLRDAHNHFNNGNIQAAESSANQARMVRENTIWWSLVSLSMLLFIGVGALITLVIRHPRPIKQMPTAMATSTLGSEDELLAQLLKQSSGDNVTR